MDQHTYITTLSNIHLYTHIYIYIYIYIVMYALTNDDDDRCTSAIS